MSQYEEVESEEGAWNQRDRCIVERCYRLRDAPDYSPPGACVMQEATPEREAQPTQGNVDMRLVEARVDSVFPHRNSDGSPSYRKHQKETIMRILTSFLVDDKMFVALDGPVGSGKSAICYTVGRVLGDAVYLTPQKQLQDQIAREHWVGVKMVKGKSAYACNHCGLENPNIRCSYSGDRYHMCNNSASGYRPKADSEETIREHIEEVLDKFHRDERLLRMRTGFEPDDDVQRVFEDIRQSVAARDEERGSITVHPIPVAIGCVMGPHECPVRSSRFLAKMAGIKLLNPDIFYMLNMGFEPAFPDNELMIIDECHTLESVIQRIFQAQLPLDTLKELFGIDLIHLYECETPAEFSEKFIYAVKTYLGPLMAASSTIAKMGDVTHVVDYDTLQEMKSQNVFAIALKQKSSSLMRHNGKLSILEIANNAFTDSDKSKIPEFLWDFRDTVRVYFLEQCERFGCETKFDIYAGLEPSCEKFFNRVGWDPEESPDRQMSKHITTLKKALDAFIDNAVNLVSMKNGDYESFVLGKTPRASTRFVCAGTELESVVKDYYTFDHVDRVIEIVPIAVGVLLQGFFYGKAKRVLLSTGTWVDVNGMFKVFGVPSAHAEYIRVPSTFIAKRRPVYVLSDKNYTDFSEKGPDKQYVYKTDAGIRKFCSEVASVIEKIRGRIEERHDKNANIVVHCHTFDIAKKIAEFCPIVDDSFLIHLSQNSMPIRNSVTGWRTEFIHKDELLQHLIHHPNSGLTLVSASVSEGVDFKHDVARAQIILKRPTPYLGSPYVNAYYRGNEQVGVRKDPNYLDRVTFTEITQQYGRVMRAADDWGYTVIMDQALAKSLYHLLSSRGEGRVSDLNLTYFASGVQGDRDFRGLPKFRWPFDQG